MLWLSLYVDKVTKLENCNTIYIKNEGRWILISRITADPIDFFKIGYPAGMIGLDFQTVDVYVHKRAYDGMLEDVYERSF